MYSAANHYVLKIAKGHGIKTVYASILAVNHIMLHMFKTRGFKLTKVEDGYYAQIETDKIILKEEV